MEVASLAYFLGDVQSRKWTAEGAFVAATTSDEENQKIGDPYSQGNFSGMTKNVSWLHCELGQWFVINCFRCYSPCRRSSCNAKYVIQCRAAIAVTELPVVVQALVLIVRRVAAAALAVFTVSRCRCGCGCFRFRRRLVVVCVLVLVGAVVVCGMRSLNCCLLRGVQCSRIAIIAYLLAV